MWATAVFAGKTEDDQKLVVYVEKGKKVLHIRVGDGELQALSPGAEVKLRGENPENVCALFATPVQFDVHNQLCIEITSPEWTGKAEGTWGDLLNERSLYR